MDMSEMEYVSSITISEFIKETLEEQGRSQRWLALMIGMNEKTLSGKLSRDNFSAKDLILIAEELGFDLNLLKNRINLNDLKSGGKMPSDCGIYKVYSDAVDYGDFKSVVDSIAINIPELDENLRPALATVILYLINECSIAYEEFVVMMCAEFWTIEQLLDNYYWYYQGVTTDNELEVALKAQNKGDQTLTFPRVFTEYGCLVFCEPPFTRFEENKLIFYKPSEE